MAQQTIHFKNVSTPFQCMALLDGLKKAWLMSLGWWHSGWGPHCWYGRRAKVLRDGKEIGGLIVVDHRTGPTVILCDDGVIQRGGVFRPVRASC